MPVKTARVHFDGLTRTNANVMLPAVKPLFEATNYEEMVGAIHAAQHELKLMGCFSQVDIMLDVDDRKVFYTL